MIDIPYDAIADYCQRRHIRSLSLFGSALGDAFGPESDIDLLIEFEEGHTPGWEIVDIGDELSAIFDNRPVDLVFPEFIIPRLKKRILGSAVPIFRSSRAA